jgi:hydroxypyruvate reductase
LAAGNDGTDGRDRATGDVARGTAARRALADNDAYGFLRASADLIVSGPTRTNLLDLYLAVRST